METKQRRKPEAAPKKNSKTSTQEKTPHPQGGGGLYPCKALPRQALCPENGYGGSGGAGVDAWYFHFL